MILRIVTIATILANLPLGANAQDPLADLLPDLNVPAFGAKIVEVSKVGKDFFKATNTELLHPKTGVIVSYVEANGPAADAQIQKLDIITHVHNRTTRTEDEFSSAISELEIGKKYSVTVFRQIELRGKVTWKKDTVKVEPVSLRDVYLNALRQEKDEVTDDASYKHHDTTKFVNNQSEFYCYFTSTKSAKPKLRLNIQYVANEWLFIRRIIIKADDKTFTLDGLGLRDIERDNGDGKVWEWHDRPVGIKEREMLNAVANAKRVILRCEGEQYQKDRELSDAEKRRVFTVLIAYRIMSAE